MLSSLQFRLPYRHELQFCIAKAKCKQRIGKLKKKNSAEDQEQNGSSCSDTALFSRGLNVKLGNCISCYFLCLCIAPQ